MDETFSIKIVFATPTIFGRRMNLDGLLANLLYQRSRQEGMDEQKAIEFAHANIPLATVDGVAAGSSALIPESETSECVFVANLMRHLTEEVNPANSLRPNASTRKGGRTFDHVPGAILNRYIAHDVHMPGLHVGFLARGDQQQVYRLLSDVGAIGKKRSVGYGKITDVKLKSVRPYEGFGLMSRDGTVLRPIPEALAERLHPEEYGIAYESIRPPYWKTERVLCRVPPRRTWDMGDIASFVEEG